MNLPLREKLYLGNHFWSEFLIFLIQAASLTRKMYGSTP